MYFVRRPASRNSGKTLVQTTRGPRSVLAGEFTEVSDEIKLALIRCAEALEISRGQWIHGVNAAQADEALRALQEAMKN